MEFRGVWQGNFQPSHHSTTIFMPTGKSPFVLVFRELQHAERKSRAPPTSHRPGINLLTKKLKGPKMHSLGEWIQPLYSEPTLSSREDYLLLLIMWRYFWAMGWWNSGKSSWHSTFDSCQRPHLQKQNHTSSIYLLIQWFGGSAVIGCSGFLVFMDEVREGQQLHPAFPCLFAEYQCSTQ